MAHSNSKTALGLLRFLSLILAGSCAAVDKRAQSGCTVFKFPVTASAKNLDITSIPSNLGNPTVLENFIVSSAESLVGGLLGGVGTIETNGTFMMSAIYCEPANVVPSRANTIQYLQHAITMRKEYWNGLTFPDGFDGETYSYMNVASQNGYATLAVDNLGNGDSEHPDPIFVTQQTLQVEVIHQILTMLREGTVPGPVAGKKFSKVIYAGHSYGSICGNGIATHHPEDIDAFILTGYSGQFALGAGPLAAGLPIPADLVFDRYKTLSPGYLADSSEEGRRFGLYTNPSSLGGFDPAIPTYDYVHEGTGSIGELATLLYGVGPADDYTGYILVITGENDAIVCNTLLGANCGQGPTSIPAQAGAFFPNAKDYSYHIPALTGHNANLHYSSPQSFIVAMEYLASKGF